MFSFFDVFQVTKRLLEGSWVPFDLFSQSWRHLQDLKMLLSALKVCFTSF
jgi:hypothetical protein